MENRNLTNHPQALLLCAIAVLVACESDTGVGVTGAALSAACVEPDAALPPNTWLCPESRTFECGEAEDATIFLVEPEGATCGGELLDVSDSGPFPPGSYAITISDPDGEAECTAELIVVDSAAPALEPQTLSLWPPNHKLHEITVADCVSALDACDGELTVEFLWASSDEPVDDIGDGHHEPDIVVSDDCQRVSVRAERQGPRDGRVYRLGVRVSDDAGNSAEGECTVIVDHDQRGVSGSDSGEAYRIVFDGSDGGPVCDGVSEPPPVDEDAGSQGS